MSGHYLLWGEVKFIILTENLTGTLRVKESIYIRLHPNNINRNVELRFSRCGYLRSDNMATNHYHNGLLREPFPPLIIPTLLWIETHQPWAGFVIHQSLTSTVVQIQWFRTFPSVRLIKGVLLIQVIKIVQCLSTINFQRFPCTVIKFHFVKEAVLYFCANVSV